MENLCICCATILARLIPIILSLVEKLLPSGISTAEVPMDLSIYLLKSCAIRISYNATAIAIAKPFVAKLDVLTACICAHVPTGVPVPEGAT